jgi:tRNA modification GTPase
MNTIFAQSSGRGKAGVTVYRISGPSSLSALEKLTSSQITELQPRKMYLRTIFYPETGIQIDKALIVYFNANSSFTGEESAEIHVHGSIAVIKLLNQALSLLDDLRVAEPGEFTKRAFLNGKFDLTAAEGLADLIDAETELQHKQAIRQLGGGLEVIYTNWRKQLLKIMSLIEAYIDFPDEEIPSEVLVHTKDNINNLCREISNHLRDNNRGERLRNGLKLAIAGKPNVGKSSLMNLLLKREIAIVSNIAGTTRDVIEGHLDIGGYPIILQDTAGIRDNSLDEIEQIGIKKSRDTLKHSDIKIIMYDVQEFNEKDIAPFIDFIDDNTIVVFNKIDEVSAHDYNHLSMFMPHIPKHILYISAKTGKNIEKLMEHICQIAEQIASPSENPQITRERHRTQLSYAFASLSNLNLENDLVLVAEDIRITIRHLSNITGVITVDEILGEIFSNFCIGK